MNEHSSRSHCIFTVAIDQTLGTAVAGDKPAHLSSRLHFCDLAGSERASRTGNKGQRFKESVHINSGLLALGNVINALTKRRGPAKPQEDARHVPYRDSKLTRMLKDALGGNARTVMLTCVGPGDANLEESLNSLRYAARARHIKNRPVVNTAPRDEQLTRMRSEIDALRRQLVGQRPGSASPAADGGTLAARLAAARTLVHRLAQRAAHLLRQVEEQTLLAPVGSAHRKRASRIVDEARRSLDDARLSALQNGLAAESQWLPLGSSADAARAASQPAPPKTALGSTRTAQGDISPAIKARPPPTAPPRVDLGGTLTLRQGDDDDRRRLPSASPRRAARGNGGPNEDESTAAAAAVDAARRELAAVHLQQVNDTALLQEREEAIAALEAANRRLRDLLRQAAAGQLPFQASQTNGQGRPKTAHAQSAQAGATWSAGAPADQLRRPQTTAVDTAGRVPREFLQRDATVLLREVRSRGRQLQSRLEEDDEVNVASLSDDDNAAEGEDQAEETAMADMRSSLANVATQAEANIQRSRVERADLQLNIRLKEQLIASLVQKEKEMQDALLHHREEVVECVLPLIVQFLRAPRQSFTPFR